MTLSIAFPGLLLAGFALFGPLWIRISLLKTGQADWLERMLPWVRSAGLLYLAVVFGWVSMRDAGLTGQSTAEWLAGAGAAIALGAAGGWLSMRKGHPVSFERWIQDETRWALYRAVAWALMMFLPLAVPAAWLVAVFEAWLECILARKRWTWNIVAPWIMRSALSGAFFILFHNIWLAYGAYALAWLVARYSVDVPAFFRPKKN
jgi:hypothetical protein